MQRLRNQFAGDDFEIIAINAGESETAVSAFLMEMEPPLTFPILLDEKGHSFKDLGIRGLPMSFLFDRQGNLIKSIMGGREWDEGPSVSLIEEALKQ